MARYKDVNYAQDKFIPLSFQKQILPGTFEYTLSYLIDQELDLGVFDERYRNDEATHTCICPAGKKLYSNGRANNLRGFEALRFCGSQRDCLPCTHRDRCFRDPEKTKTRQVAIFIGRSKQAPPSYLELMKKKIDTPEGRYQYSRRMGVVEPVFGNICNTLGLHRFSLRTRKQVDIQW